MPDQRENLQDATTYAEPALNFSYNELLEEIANRYSLPRVKGGDVTARMLAKRLHKTVETARTILMAEVEQGLLETYDAKDGKGHKIKAFRKKGKEEGIGEPHPTTLHPTLPSPDPTLPSPFSEVKMPENGEGGKLGR